MTSKTFLGYDLSAMIEYKFNFSEDKGQIQTLDDNTLKNLADGQHMQWSSPKDLGFSDKKIISKIPIP